MLQYYRNFDSTSYSSFQSQRKKKKPNYLFIPDGKPVGHKTLLVILSL